jgi:hypothetical protein
MNSSHQSTDSPFNLSSKAFFSSSFNCSTCQQGHAPEADISQFTQCLDNRGKVLSQKQITLEGKETSIDSLKLSNEQRPEMLKFVNSLKVTLANSLDLTAPNLSNDITSDVDLFRIGLNSIRGSGLVKQ